MWGGPQKNEDDSSDDDSSEEDSDEESDDGAGPSNSAAQELSREERKKEKKAKKDAAIARAKAAAIQVGDLPPSDSESEEEEEDNMPANPNHSKAARKQLKPQTEDEVEEAAKGVSKLSVKQPQSRREREASEAAAAKERYMKLHLAGKTDQAQADMERLRAIREKREAEKARKDVCPTRLDRNQSHPADRVRVARPSVRRKRSKTRSDVLRSRPRRPRSARQPLGRPRRLARSPSRVTASTRSLKRKIGWQNGQKAEDIFDEGMGWERGRLLLSMDIPGRWAFLGPLTVS